MGMVQVRQGVAAMPSMEMEAEPKTLTLQQLNYAREAALYVVSTKTTEEAVRIFTEGLKPVKSICKRDVDSSDDDVELDSSPRVHGHCIKRDVATAPF